MANLYADYQNLIRFVSPGNNQKHTSKKSDNDAGLESLTGDEAKSFYETLVTGDQQNQQDGSARLETERTSSHRKKRHKKNKQTLSVQKHDSSGEKVRVKAEYCQADQQTQHDDHPDNLFCSSVESLRDVHKRLLMYAQNGELSQLKKLIENSAYVDINFQDQYGWTALMCACVGKHKNSMEYLLSKGANKTIVNKVGKTAADLCEEIHAYRIRDALFLYQRNQSTDRSPASVTQKTTEFHCDVCKMDFKETTKNAHISSTVHLFNLKLKPKTDTFMIPKTNVGYQLMKQSGWDGETGLGPDGEGQKYPVKTVLKRDRACIGATSSNDTQAKVTHFGPHDKDAIQSVKHKHSERVMSVRTASRKAQKRQVEKDKAWERKLRLYMNMD